MSTLAQDLRYGARMLAKNPGVAALAVLSIALGVGANTAIFSMVNAILLRPLSIDKPEEVVTIFSNWRNDPGYSSVSYPDFLDHRERTEVFSSLASYAMDGFGLQGDGEAQVAFGMTVSDEFFEVTGTRPYLGRFFLPEENRTPGRIRSWSSPTPAGATASVPTLESSAARSSSAAIPSRSSA